LSRIKDWPATYTNVPAMKYEPSSMLTTAPWPTGVIPVAPTFPKSAEPALLENTSPAINFSTVLLAPPEFIYLIYNVAGSDPVAAIACNTKALTWLPLWPVPVMVVPTKATKLAPWYVVLYVVDECVNEASVNLIKSYSVLRVTLPPITLEPSLKLYWPNLSSWAWNAVMMICW